MCGISFCASKTQQKAPEWLQSLLKESACNFSAKYYRSVEFTAPEIAQLIAQDVARDVHLSEDDTHKLANVEKLRELQTLANVYKNGQHKAENREKFEAVRAEMAGVLDTGALLESSSDGVGAQFGPANNLRAVLARGPDYAKYAEFGLSGNHYQIFSSVLSLRQPFTKQPYSSTEWVLQFNGELYNPECRDINDTGFIMALLESEISSGKSRSQAVAATIGQLAGEFAYVLVDTADSKVYFGKDFVGKRSLLFNKTQQHIFISSVCPENTADVVECRGNEMYVIDLSTYEVSSHVLANEKLLPNTGRSSEIGQELENQKLQKLHQFLLDACEKRQSTIHPIHPNSEDALIGILFSGGLDCTVLAALIGENFVRNKQSCLIDLLTVGFDNPRTGLSAAESPDRLLSEQSWYELCKLFHGTGVSFRLVQVDVSYSEWLAHKQRVRGLIYPCATEMDLSIAIAFYFATRSSCCERWEVTDNIVDATFSSFTERKDHFVKTQSCYTSQAKVLFSGLGADELFGGYSRHENLFHGLTETSSEEEVSTRYDELSQSLLHDITVIFERNLGRDDRAMSTWGKELRYPYLDEAFIKWVVTEVDPQFKIGFEWGIQRTKKGEKRVMKVERKRLLRRLAEKLGLELAAKEMKRAIQFGAKSAKMEVGQHKAKGTDSL